MEINSNKSEKVLLSIIVPLYNEEDNIPILYSNIIRNVDPLGIKYEIIYVDDGSTDNTYKNALEIAKIDGRLKIIKFRKNCGQTPAMVAGIDYARGEILVTMDGDLQNDPADIPIFINKIYEGNDLVCGWRKNRQDKLVTRKIPSQIANRIIGKITGVPIKDNGCSLKAYRADLIKAVPLYSEMHRFIPAMASIAGCKITQIPVRHHARKFGKTKYGLSRIYKVLLDLLKIKTLVTFTAKPLVWFGGMAILSFLCSGAVLVVLLKKVFYEPAEPIVVLIGTTMLMSALGMFLLFCGILGELIYKTGNLKLSTFARIRASSIGGRHALRRP